MSAALQLPMLCAGPAALQPQLLASAHVPRQLPKASPEPKTFPEIDPVAQPPAEPVVSWAFYRKHTGKLLRRYLYASTQVGRSPNILGESVDRGWVSSRPVRTFEDALIFVLDIERCLQQLSALDRQIISRVLLQEYTQAETAALIGISLRTVCTTYPQAIDRLTELLVKADLLTLPE